jgi:dihydroxyacetone kinase-like protein
LILAKYLAIIKIDRFFTKEHHIRLGGLGMKKIINDAADVEQEMIQGLVKAAPKKLRKLDCGTVVVRAQKKSGKVALVSGGGSGHEPAHGGFVGQGMLDCAVAGPVFTSPTPDQIYEGIKAVATEEGVLCVVKNYTGDVMNFEMAIDMAKDEDIKADYVVVNDDVAVKDSLYTTGRRGVAGTILVHKIAGAKAEKGASLPEVKAVAEKTIANVRSMGMAIAPCTVPAAGKPGFELAEDEMEIGIGIHGEPGTHREKIAKADDIAKTLLDKILTDIDYSGHEVVVLVNGMGATPLMELYIVNDFVQDYLASKNVKVYDTMVGNFMTSIEMAGFSLTLLRLDDEMKQLYEAEADTLAFKK